MILMIKKAPFFKVNSLTKLKPVGIKITTGRDEFSLSHLCCTCFHCFKVKLCASRLVRRGGLCFYLSNHLSLPRRDLQQFDGNPLQCLAFLRAFKQSIEDKTIPKWLHFLEHYTQGQWRELIRSCQQMAPERGYSKAKPCWRNILVISRR